MQSWRGSLRCRAGMLEVDLGLLSVQYCLGCREGQPRMQAAGRSCNGKPRYAAACMTACAACACCALHLSPAQQLCTSCRFAGLDVAASREVAC